MSVFCTAPDLSEKLPYESTLPLFCVEYTSNYGKLYALAKPTKHVDELILLFKTKMEPFEEMASYLSKNSAEDLPPTKSYGRQWVQSWSQQTDEWVFMHPNEFDDVKITNLKKISMIVAMEKVFFLTDFLSTIGGFRKCFPNLQYSLPLEGYASDVGERLKNRLTKQPARIENLSQ